MSRTPSPAQVIQATSASPVNSPEKIARMLKDLDGLARLQTFQSQLLKELQRSLKTIQKQE